MKKGFTLAEVLITLGIVGIVAAMTLPSVISNYKKKEVPIQLKKFYSVLQNAMLQSTLDNGAIEYWEFPSQQSNYEMLNKFTKKYLFPYIVGIKECDDNRNNGNQNFCNKVRNNFSEQTGTRGYVPIYIMPSGGCFKVSTGGAGDWGTNLHFLYDYNCLGKPNKMDIDIFEFFFQYVKAQNKVKMTVGFNTENKNRVELMEICKQRVGSCGALIQYDGWEIKDDYPWIR